MSDERFQCGDWVQFEDVDNQSCMLGYGMISKVETVDGSKYYEVTVPDVCVMRVPENCVRKAAAPST